MSAKKIFVISILLVITILLSIRVFEKRQRKTKSTPIIPAHQAQQITKPVVDKAEPDIATPKAPKTVTTTPSTLSSTFVSYLIDEKANRAGISGTDVGLGVPRGNDKTWLIFGDTQFIGKHAGGSAVAVSTSPYCTGSSCPDIEWKMSGGKFFSPLTSAKTVGSDMSTVPAGGVEIDGKLYIFASRMIEWGFQLLKGCAEENGIMAGSNCNAKKTYNAVDGYVGTGGTHSYGLLYKENPDGSFSETNTKWDLNGLHLRTAPLKGQLHDGTQVVYMVTTGQPTPSRQIAYRSTPLYMAYVEPSKIEDKTAYKYLVGLDGSRNPIWSDNSANAKPLSGMENLKVGEPSFVYNSVLKKYLIMFKDYSGKRVFSLFISDNPYGPYSEFEVEGCGTKSNRPSWWESKWKTPWSGCYGGYIIPNLFGQDGKDIYFNVSLWQPYKVVTLKTRLP